MRGMAAAQVGVKLLWIIGNTPNWQRVRKSDAPLNLIPDRIWQFDKYIATSINIEIVDFHHSIITIQGEYEEKGV
mgnify:CR=1 FL=1